MYVGDIIQMAREMIPDAAPSMGTPPVPTITQSVVNNTLPAGTYFVRITNITLWGETLPSPEGASVVVDGTHSPHVVATLLPGATKVRAYFGIGTGNENQWVESVTGTFDITAPGTGGTIPVRNTAYFPDMDGQTFSAAMLFRWLTLGLREASQATGGLPSYSGVPTVAGEPMYTMSGEWIKITDCWYDGWPLNLEKRTNFFKRNTVTSSVLSGVALSLLDDRVILETWPQPNRSATITTLTSDMAVTSTVANVVSTAGYLLPTDAFIQIGSPATGVEICSYAALASTSITGLVRAYGGTVAKVWPAGTAVTEANLVTHGRYIVGSNAYYPGTSASVLHIPSGWDALLASYILSKARDAEGDVQASQAQYQKYQAALTQWARTNRQLAGPQQISAFRAGGYATYGGTQFGRFVIN